LSTPSQPSALHVRGAQDARKWTPLSCQTFAANTVRLQLHALAYNLGNFQCTLATPEPIKDWFLSSLQEKLIKIGAMVISHGRSIAFQMAEVAIPRHGQRRCERHRRLVRDCDASSTVFQQRRNHINIVAILATQLEGSNFDAVV
jgi:hypothetical protein